VEKITQNNGTGEIISERQRKKGRCSAEPRRANLLSWEVKEGASKNAIMAGLLKR